MKVKALIVDDSSVMRKIVERSLRQAGIDLSEVVEAGNGVEALSALRLAAVDLILCDISGRGNYSRSITDRRVRLCVQRPFFWFP